MVLKGVGGSCGLGRGDSWQGWPDGEVMVEGSERAVPLG